MPGISTTAALPRDPIAIPSLIHTAASTSHAELIMFPRDALATISQTQVRATNSRQPSSKSRANDRLGRGGPARRC
ncbi:MAG: hypothetical protein JWM19_1947 [Actinomycetia bacterium]|nr:hypothetical protein [Actinomycetes bacterium]